mmetsp:Transcript_9227/g.17493  ORF Transcript_9227/g.17493 Transcript_9227/m.17493 type:complete len:519 (-) Transcript_9227:229-1785(-)
METSAPDTTAADGEVATTEAAGEDSVVNAVQEALEAMLSKHNLVRDQFLAGNMNPQMYIPISVLLAHEKLGSVGATEASVIAAATRSTRLGIDDHQSMVRPLLKSKRNVVILRDIPSDATEHDIRELFVGAPHAELIVSVKPEVNNTWFVKFKLDEGTQDVVLWLRSQKFRGQPVNAAIKSEHFLRSFFPLQLAGPPMPPMGYQGLPRPPMDFGGAPPPPPIQDYSGMGWPGMNGGEAMAFAGKGMAGKPGMPPPPPPQYFGPQLPGFWQPWGARLQPPPLVFLDATTPASASMPVVAQQASPMGPEILDNVTGAHTEEGKGKMAKGMEKGKGKEWGKGGKWGEEMGKGGKWGDEKGYRGKPGDEVYGKGKFGDDKGGKGKWADDKGGKGKAPWGAWAKTNAEPEPQADKGARRKGGRSGGSDSEGGGTSGGKGKAKWVVRSSAPAEDSQEAATSLPNSGANATTYKHDFRKYDRSQFDEVSRELHSETLVAPESVSALSSEIPIFRDSPTLELAAAA